MSTHNTIILLHGGGWSTTEFHGVLVDVKVNLPHEVLDLVQSRFQFPILKDRISGCVSDHTGRGSVATKTVARQVTNFCLRANPRLVPSDPFPTPIR